MTIPFLQSTSNCGPDNPLASLTKIIQPDRPIFKDKFYSTSSASNQKSTRHPFSLHQSNQKYSNFNDREERFFLSNNNQNSSINLNDLEQEINQIQFNSQPQPPSQLTHDWSSAFLKSAPISHSFEFGSIPTGASQVQHNDWKNQFIQSSQNISQPPPSNLLGINSSVNQSSRLIHPPNLSYSHLNHFSRLSPHRSAIKPLDLQTNAIDWDSEFLKYDRSLSASLINQDHFLQNDKANQKYLDRSTSPIISTSPDVLAKTAGSLLEIVKEKQLIDSQTELDQASQSITNQKFNQSNFMELMRKLRDGEAKVEGDKLVEQLAPSQHNSLSGFNSQALETVASGQLHHTSGGVWANDYAQAFQSPEDIFQQAESPLESHRKLPHLTSVRESHFAPTQEGLTEARVDLEARMAEMQKFFEETDRDIDHAQFRATMNRFQGDGGAVSDIDDILNAASEVDRPIKQNWTNTSVIGATEKWSEELLESHQGQDEGDFDESGMFGRPLSIHELRMENLKRSQQAPSAQQREWEKLQADWEKFAEEDPLETNILRQNDLVEKMTSIETKTGYQFQHTNPYLHLQPSSRHHFLHNQWNNSLLEQLPHGSLDSVLQKEVEVLKSSESAAAWFELGVKQQANEREDMAIEALQQAIKLDPQLSDAILALAISYTNENRRGEAFEEIERWIKVEMEKVPKYKVISAQTPINSQIISSEENQQVHQMASKHQILTDTLIQLARLGGRVEGCASIDPDVQVALGVLFNISEEYGKSSDCFSAALSVRPEDPILFNRLGATLANDGKPHEAIEHYKRALELLPTYIRAQYNLSISLINLGQYRTSAENLLCALEMQEADSNQMNEALRLIESKTSDVEKNSHIESPQRAQKTGVTSDVLWQTLEVNCSLLRDVNLADSLAKRDIKGLKEKLNLP